MLLPNLSALTSAPSDGKIVKIYETTSDDDSLEDDDDSYSDDYVKFTPKMRRNEKLLSEFTLRDDLQDVIDRLEKAHASVIAAAKNPEINDTSFLKNIALRLDSDIRMLKSVIFGIGLEPLSGGTVPLRSSDLYRVKKSVESLNNNDFDQWSPTLALVAALVYLLSMYLNASTVVRSSQWNPSLIPFPMSATAAKKAMALKSFRKAIA